jgi:hypothetical protein
MGRGRYLMKASWVFGILVAATVLLQVTGLAPAMKSVGAAP